MIDFLIGLFWTLICALILLLTFTKIEELIKYLSDLFGVE